MNQKQKAADIGNAALDFDAGPDRDEYIDRCCRGDRELKLLVLGYVQSCSAIGVKTGRWIGPYQIVEELGRGAMGVVFRGYDPRIGRAIAIKQVRLHQFLAVAEQDVLRMRFAREATAAGKLSHANIVTIHQLGEFEGSQYLVMELVNGPSLEQMLSPGVPMDSNATLAILRQIADALDYAHGEEVVHRDIKPGNVLVLPDGRVKITDFGIARIASMSTVTQTGMTMGTPAYMAPEQITGAKVDGRADQFSLGVMAFQMMTGSKPFEADSTHALMFKIVSEEPPLLHTVKPSLPPASSEALKRALGKTPDNRYGSCVEFVESLAAAFEERATPTTSVPLPSGHPPLTDDTGLPTTVLNTVVPIRAEVAEFPRRRTGLGSYVLIAVGLVALAGVASIAYKRSKGTGSGDTSINLTTARPVAPRGEDGGKSTSSLGEGTRGAVVGDAGPSDDIGRVVSKSPMRKKIVEHGLTDKQKAESYAQNPSQELYGNYSRGFLRFPEGTYTFHCPTDPASDCTQNIDAFWMDAGSVSPEDYKKITGFQPSHLPLNYEAAVSSSDAVAYCLSVGGRVPTVLPYALQWADVERSAEFDKKGRKTSGSGVGVHWCYSDRTLVKCDGGETAIATPNEKFAIRCMYGSQPRSFDVKLMPLFKYK